MSSGLVFEGRCQVLDAPALLPILAWSWPLSREGSELCYSSGHRCCGSLSTKVYSADPALGTRGMSTEQRPKDIQKSFDSSALLAPKKVIQLSQMRDAPLRAKILDEL